MLIGFRLEFDPLDENSDYRSIVFGQDQQIEFNGKLWPREVKLLNAIYSLIREHNREERFKRQNHGTTEQNQTETRT